MNLEHIQAFVADISEVVAWPELKALLLQSSAESHVEWQLPILACQSAGGNPHDAIPVAVALMCMRRSIILVDDMLDQDPRGLHHSCGTASTANLAVALQAMAIHVISNMQIAVEAKALLTASFAEVGLRTSYGQWLDIQKPTTEEDYWNVIRSKSAPFYAHSVYAGALCANTSKETCESLQQFGRLLGEIVQLYDDLVDALQIPASPDWRVRNNLLIHYALTAEHNEKKIFTKLVSHVDDVPILKNAQDILVRSGAISYCLYQLILRSQSAYRILQNTRLANPTPLLDLLNRQIEPVLSVFRMLNADFQLEIFPK